jgi:hypothetical protein
MPETPTPEGRTRLRDEIAIAAMLVVIQYDPDPTDFSPSWIAAQAYALADAMLEAREGVPTP